jgi:hypothetical protein
MASPQTIARVNHLFELNEITFIQTKHIFARFVCTALRAHLSACTIGRPDYSARLPGGGFQACRLIRAASGFDIKEM